MYDFYLFSPIVPPPKFYVQLNPIQVYMDVLSILWANSFALNLHQSLQKSTQEMNTSLPYVDVKIEAVMPRVSHLLTELWLWLIQFIDDYELQ